VDNISLYSKDSKLFRRFIIMETRQIKTLVKSDHALGEDMFVLGRIMGAMAVMCKDDPAKGIEYVIDYCSDGNIFMIETTEAKYEAFANVIENWYTGLCVFDYVE
jgi:hypothetical protein